MRKKKKAGQIALKVGIAGAITFGALASGFLMSRRGRRFLRDVWHERRRTPLEDQILDTIWGEPILGRRPVDVHEVEPGVVIVAGKVRSHEEQRALLNLAKRVRGVSTVENRVEVLVRRR